MLLGMIKLTSALIIATLLCGSALAAAPTAPVAPAAPRPPTVPPPRTVQPKACDQRASADHIPGVDINGDPVAPADLPSANDVQISTEVYAETRSPNPQLRGVGVIANLPNLGSPNCAPKPAKPRN